jgi:hypothetical protein
MRSITFSIRPHVTPTEQSAVLDRVNQVPGVHAAQSLSPSSKSAEVRRLCYASVADGASLESVLHLVDALPEVENVEVPATRSLS